MIRGIYSTRGAVSWVALTWDISALDGGWGARQFEECMDPFEHIIGRGVAAPVVPPGIDNPLVVTIEDEILFSTWSPGDCVHEEFKADGFSPSNVPGTVEGLPTGDEAPGTPAVSKHNANADA
jgi:hypothetical protein